MRSLCLTLLLLSGLPMNAAFADLSYFCNHPVCDKPCVHKCMRKTDTLPPCTLYHFKSGVILPGVKFFETPIVRIVLTALLLELKFTLLAAEAVLPFSPLFPVHRQIAGISAASIKYGKHKKLETWHTSVLDMIKNTAQAFKMKPCLLLCGVVYNVTL